MRYIIEVTAEDIADGFPGSVASCPVALAVARSLGIRGRWGNIDVDSNRITIWWSDDEKWHRTRGGLPRSIGRFIKRFDAHEPVKPIRFGLTVPDPIHPAPEPRS